MASKVLQTTQTFLEELKMMDIILKMMNNINNYKEINKNNDLKNHRCYLMLGNIHSRQHYWNVDLKYKIWNTILRKTVKECHSDQRNAANMKTYISYSGRWGTTDD